MREAISKLRAALTPQVLLWLAGLFLLALGLTGRNADISVSLEQRIEKTLSAVQGAGRVQVVIRAQTVQEKGALSSPSEKVIISGAVAVAPGADDPLVHLELQEALCTLLDLPPSAVSVMTGGK